METLTISQELVKNVRRLKSFIGNTPLIALDRIYKKPGVKVYAKLEWNQLGGSVKARAAYNIISEAIYSGELNEDKILLDATSGNTGIAYAAIGAALGIRVKLLLPKNASEERKKMLEAFGAELIQTSPVGGTDEAQQKAKELYAANPELYFYADQYSNVNNWKAHYNSTADEIIQQTYGEVTHFVAGLGTSGTFVGTGRKLKKWDSDIHLTALQPDLPLHGLEGWKHMETAIVPAFYDKSVADNFLEVSTYDAYDLIKELAVKEGLLVSPSAAANLAGAIQVANSIDEGVVVTVFPDNAEKYGEVLKELFNNYESWKS